MYNRKVSIKWSKEKWRKRRWWVYFANAKNKRESQYFETRAEAELYAEAVKNRLKNHGLAALSLPDSGRRDAQEALELLRPLGKTITEAARFFIAHLERTEASCLIEVLVEPFLSEKGANELSKRHLEDLRSRTSRFAREFGGRIINGIEADEITNWLRNLEGGPHNRQNARRVLHNFFSYAVRRKMIEKNPVSETPSIRIPDHEIAVYSPEEMRLLLENADGAIVPYLALGAFTGLRSAELLRLDWSAVDFNTGNIWVNGAIAKTRSKRLVPMSSNLRSWLEGRFRPNELILTKEKQWKLRDMLRAACEKAGFKWKNNALRHSYATYRMAVTGDAARTSLEMGNSPNIVFKHYRQLVTKEKAEAFWNISPKIEFNVLPVASVAA